MATIKATSVRYHSLRGRISKYPTVVLRTPDIQVTDRGAIQVNDHLKPASWYVFAVRMSMVVLSSTIIIYRWLRIVFNYLTGDDSYNLKTRRLCDNTLHLLLHWPKSKHLKHALKDFRWLSKGTSCCVPWPCQYRPSRVAFKPWIVKPKKFLGDALWRSWANHQPDYHGDGQQDPALHPQKSNLYPTLGQKSLSVSLRFNKNAGNFSSVFLD